jgi:hypothetical protein
MERGHNIGATMELKPATINGGASRGCLAAYMKLALHAMSRNLALLVSAAVFVAFPDPPIVSMLAPSGHQSAKCIAIPLRLAPAISFSAWRY